MEASNQSGQFDLGHWILRLIALIIDSIILGIVSWILATIATVGFLATAALGFWFFGGIYLVILLLYGVLAVLYFLVLDVAW